VNPDKVEDTMLAQMLRLHTFRRVSQFVFKNSQEIRRPNPEVDDPAKTRCKSCALTSPENKAQFRVLEIKSSDLDEARACMHRFLSSEMSVLR
jgi:Pyruvate/2-oxoacid:ferredoxin oxidoreductase delta subunit